MYLNSVFAVLYCSSMIFTKNISYIRGEDYNYETKANEIDVEYVVVGGGCKKH